MDKKQGHLTVVEATNLETTQLKMWRKENLMGGKTSDLRSVFGSLLKKTTFLHTNKIQDFM